MVLGTGSFAARRRARNRQEMVDAILHAGRQVMREDGVAALNLAEVARRVGVSAPSLYEYFESKDALYDALFRLGVRLWAERVEALRSSEFETPWDFLLAVFEAYLDFADDHPEMYQLIHERPVPGFVPSPESLAESVRLTEIGAEALAEWADRGELAPGVPPDQAFDLVIAVMHGLTGGHVANEPGNRSPDSRFRRLVPPALELFRAAWSRRGAGTMPQQ
ncbi:MAG: hypothetical protein Kow0010_11120 [Dehalococcoidia bacterium]